MARFKIYCEYEGTRFSGWQIQKNARTVQGEIHNALLAIVKNPDFELYGSGRTDAGVHALYQVAHLDADTMLAPEIIRMKLNDALPADINILEVEKAPKLFHARHDAIARSYLYQISRRRTAFGKKFVWWIKDDLNFSAMTRTAALFEGMKNFQSFTADDEAEKSMKVMVEDIQLKESGDLILVRIVGSHFLWKMVRQLVGVMAEVGRGKLSVKDVQHMMDEKSDSAARLTAPPSGLFLERVYYKGDERLKTLEPMMTIEQTSVRIGRTESASDPVVSNNALKKERAMHHDYTGAARTETHQARTPHTHHQAHTETRPERSSQHQAHTEPRHERPQHPAHAKIDERTTGSSSIPERRDRPDKHQGRTKASEYREKNAPTYYKPGVKKKRRP